MADKATAQNALLGLIDSVAKEVQESNLNLVNKAAAARDLALAYRYVAGGQQPGGVAIAKD